MAEYPTAGGIAAKNVQIGAITPRSIIKSPPMINGPLAATRVSFVVLGAEANGTNPVTGNIPQSMAVQPKRTVLLFTCFGLFSVPSNSDIPLRLVAKLENSINSPIRHVMITLGSMVGVPQANGCGTAMKLLPDHRACHACLKLSVFNS